MAESFDGVVGRIDGQEVRFARLQMAEYTVLENALRNKRRKVLKAALDEIEIIGPDRLVALRDLELTELGVLQVNAHVGTSAGAEAALMLSLKKGGKTDDEAKAVIAKLDIMQAIDIARVVIGFVPMEPAKKADAGGDDAKPEQPAAAA